MQSPDGGADLIVGIGGYVFHKEIDEAGFALQDAKELQSAVGRFDLRDFGDGVRFFDLRQFYVAEGLGYIGRKFAAEEDTEEAAERVTDTRQIRLLRNYQDTSIWLGSARTTPSSTQIGSVISLVRAGYRRSDS